MATRLRQLQMKQWEIVNCSQHECKCSETHRYLIVLILFLILVLILFIHQKSSSTSKVIFSKHRQATNRFYGDLLTLTFCCHRAQLWQRNVSGNKSLQILFVACLCSEKMTFRLNILSWALIFIIRITFPPGQTSVLIWKLFFITWASNIKSGLTKYLKSLWNFKPQTYCVATNNIFGMSVRRVWV